MRREPRWRAFPPFFRHRADAVREVAARRRTGFRSSARCGIGAGHRVGAGSVGGRAPTGTGADGSACCAPARDMWSLADSVTRGVCGRETGWGLCDRAMCALGIRCSDHGGRRRSLSTEVACRVRGSGRGRPRRCTAAVATPVRGPEGHGEEKAGAARRRGRYRRRHVFRGARWRSRGGGRMRPRPPRGAGQGRASFMWRFTSL